MLATVFGFMFAKTRISSECPERIETQHLNPRLRLNLDPAALPVSLLILARSATTSVRLVIKAGLWSRFPPFLNGFRMVFHLHQSPVGQTQIILLVFVGRVPLYVSMKWCIFIQHFRCRPCDGRHWQCWYWSHRLGHREPPRLDIGGSKALKACFYLGTCQK